MSLAVYDQASPLPSHEATEGALDAEVLAAGVELDGRFRIVRKLGRGGMGHVYEATDLRLGRSVAVKLLRSASGASTDLRRRFEREARAVAQVQHENVVTVFDYGVAPTKEPYLVMEYLIGQDLRGLLREQGCVAAPRAVRLMHDACLGLAAAHARGIIHRDLKPENLFLTLAGRRTETCKVLDFGLAKLRVPQGQDFQTREGMPFGTLHYMSPEQARGEAGVDERTDVYSAAAVLYELLSGERPHQADSPYALLHKITHERPPRIERKCDLLPPGLADVVHYGLAPDPALRPATIQAFASLLEPFAGPRHAAEPAKPAVEPSGKGAALETEPVAVPGSAGASLGSAWPRSTTLVVVGLLAGTGIGWLGSRLQLAGADAPEAAASLQQAATASAPLPSFLADAAVALQPSAALTAWNQPEGPTPKPRSSPRPYPISKGPITVQPQPAPTLSSPLPADPMPAGPENLGFDRQNPYDRPRAAER